MGKSQVFFIFSSIDFLNNFRFEIHLYKWGEPIIWPKSAAYWSLVCATSAAPPLEFSFPKIAHVYVCFIQGRSKQVNLLRIYCFFRRFPYFRKLLISLVFILICKYLVTSFVMLVFYPEIMSDSSEWQA